jgi:small-conductance mechanosensitive channel
VETRDLRTLSDSVSKPDHCGIVVIPTLIPVGALIDLAVVGFLALRRFSDVVRVVFDFASFCLLSAYLLIERVAPIFPPLSEPFEPSAMWVRAAAGAWWLLGAQIAVSGLRLARRRDQHSREARLFWDLSAAVIYIATAAIVLGSVFAVPETGIVATSGVAAIVLGLALQNKPICPCGSMTRIGPSAGSYRP